MRTKLFLSFALAATSSVLNAQDARSPAKDGHLILSVEEGDSSVGFYDSRTYGEVGRVYLGHVKETQRERRGHDERHRSYVGMWPHEIAVSTDGKTAFVTHFGLKDYDELIGATGSTISVINIDQMCESRRLYTFGSGTAPLEEQYFKYRAPHGVKLQPETSRLFVNVEANLAGENNHHMLVYDLSTDQDVLERRPDVPVFVWDIPEKTHNFIFSNDGSSLWLFSGPDGVTRYSVPTSAVFLSPRERARFVPKKGAVRGLTLTNDGSRLIASGSGEVLVLDAHTLKLEQTIAIPEVRQFLYSSVTQDGQFAFVPAVWEGKVYPIDLNADPPKVGDPVVLGSDPVHVALAPGEETLYVTHGRDNYISVVDIVGFTSGKNAAITEIGRIKTHDGPNRVAAIPMTDQQIEALQTERKRIRFAACLPLSGQNSVEGADMRLGYQYWRDSVNERGGLCVDGEAYEVELAFRDTESLSKGDDADQLISEITQELIGDAEGDKVPLFFLGTYPTPPNIAAAAIAKEKKLPFVTAGAAGVVVYRQGQGMPSLDNIFGVMSPARGFLNGTMDMMLADTGVLPDDETAPTTGVFITSDDFGAFQDAVTTARHVLGNYRDEFSILDPEAINGGFKAFRVEEIPSENHIPSFSLITYEHPETNAEIDLVQSEFPRLLRLIQEKLEPELVALTAHMPQAIDFAEAAAQVWPTGSASIPKAIVLSVGPGNPSFSQQLARRGVSPENVLGASVWSPNQRQYGHDEFIESQTFREKFEAKFHKPPSYLTAGAVVCGLVYEEAFRRTKSISPEHVRTALQSISDHAENSEAKGSIELFYSRIDFRDDAEIRGLNDKRPLGTIQLQGAGERIHDVVLWPKSLRQDGRRLVYPFPGFKSTGSRSRLLSPEQEVEQWKY